MVVNEVAIFLVIGNVILLIFIIGAVMFMMQYRKRKLEHEQEKTNLKNLHEQEILRTQFEIQSQTLQDIGRELHDNVGQKLTLASLYLAQMTQDSGESYSMDRVTDINSIVNESLQDLRALSKSLTLTHIHESSLKDLLEHEIRRLANAGKFAYQLNYDLISNFSPYVKTILLRIVQEFFQNSVKHSKGNQLFLELSEKEKAIEILLKDNGTGFDIHSLPEAKGIGLENIKHRIQLLTNEFLLQSSQNGTVLHMTLHKSKLYSI